MDYGLIFGNFWMLILILTLICVKRKGCNVAAIVLAFAMVKYYASTDSISFYAIVGILLILALFTDILDIKKLCQKEYEKKLKKEQLKWLKKINKDDSRDLNDFNY